jgi:hypothetical protein
MVVGIGASILAPIFFPLIPALNAFPIILVISLIGCFLGSYFTETEPDEVLMKFYIRVRPWGAWGPIRKKVEERFPEFKANTNFIMDAFNIIIGIIWQTSLVAAPIFLVIKEYGYLLLLWRLLLLPQLF